MKDIRRMNYQIWRCFLLMVGCLLLWNTVLTQDVEGFSPETIETLNRIGRAHNGHFVLSGVVVDEDGQHVNGVTVKLKKIKFVDVDFSKGLYSAPGTGGEDVDKPGVEREIKIVKGAFYFDLQGYCYVGLTFKRDGYYEEKLEFGAKLSEEQEHRIDSEVTVEHYEEQLKSRTDLSPDQKEDIKEIIKEYKERIKNLPKVTVPEVIEGNLRVVLEKQGKLTDLIEYEGRLEYTTTGKGVIIDFDIQGGSLGTPRRRVNNIEDPKKLPENCVYMVAEKDRDGSIAVVNKIDRKNQGEYVVPKRIRLIMNAEGGGFVRYKLDQDKKPTRQMKEAPETGYEKEIVIESDDIYREGGAWEGVIFYFKTRDKYGKGSVGWVEVSEDRSTLKLRASFDLQPDGSRNLETGDR